MKENTLLSKFLSSSKASISLILVFLYLLGHVSFAEAEQVPVPVEVERFTVKPVDSVDAERVRIWIPVEGAYSCLTKATIYDSAGTPILMFLNTLLQRGYYNFYWDKRDSIGQFVAPGNYTYKSEVCNKTRTGKLQVVFREWERYIHITIHDSARPPDFVIETDKDSAKISLSTYFGEGRIADEVAKDTVLMKGEHHFIWQPKINLPPGLYRFSLTIDDYQYDTDFSYRP